MKITAPAPALKAALARVGKIVASRNVIPVLETVLVQAYDKITITASNLEITAQFEISGTVEEAGETCIPVAELSRLIGLAKASSVTIEVAKELASIRFGSASAQIICLPAEDFPIVGLDDDLPTVDGGLIEAALRYCAPSSSADETRYFLNGVHMEERDGITFAVATDGHRISVAEMPGLSFGANGIIPRQAVPLIIEAATSDLPFWFKVTENSWALKAPGMRMKGPCIDGTFPDWRRIMPGLRAEHVAVVDSALLANATLVASVGYDSKAESAIVLDVRDGAITVFGEYAAKNMAQSGRQSVAADVSSPGFVCVNPNYLATAIAVAGSELVALAVFDRTAGIDVLPAEQRTDLRLSTRVIGRRTSLAQVAA